MKAINFLIISALFLVACKKEEDKITTIEGQLMASCDVPAANTSGFILTNDGLLSGPGISLSFTTDENGYFKVSHKGKADQLNSFIVRVQGSSDVLKVAGLPGENKNLGKVYINPFPTNFIIKLDVRNPYTENDTLVLMDYSSSNPLAQRKIAGPFESGVLEIIESHPFNMFPLHFSQTINGNTPKYGVRFHMIPFTGDIERFDFNIAPICSGEFAEVTLVID